MTSEALFFTRDDTSADAIASSLQPLLHTRSSPIARHRVVFLDTFDGRVTASGGGLAWVGHERQPRLEWRQHNRHVRLEGHLKTSPAFAWELPPGPFRERLERIIDVRRLLPQFEVDTRGRQLHVLDDHCKTVTRIRVETARARALGQARAWHRLPTLVTLTSMRGYDVEFTRLLSIVESRPALERCLAGLQGIAFQAIGAPLPRDVSRFEVALEPRTRVDEGARAIHRALLEIMVANEPGVRADLDSEFLHDYRVALRRTRSLLAQIKGVFPPDAVDRYRAEFRWLGQVTGPTRDMDVLLLSLREGPEGVPEADVRALRPYVAQRQRREHRSMVKQFDAARYRRLVSGWGRFLEGSGSTDGAESSRAPLEEVVAPRVRWLFRRLTFQASTISDDSPAAVVHRVRLDAKKLRYLLDATRSLHEGDEFNELVRRLKKLQTVLGEFNDTQVHEHLLLEIGRGLARRRTGQSALLLSVRRLVEPIHAQGVSLRPRVARELKRLCTREMRSEVRRVFRVGATAEDGS